MRKLHFLTAALLLAACSSARPAGPPGFDPLDFFTGASHGEGQLKVAMKAPVAVHVQSRGHADGHGGIILDQTIREGSKPPRQRRWVLRPSSATTVVGTITDNPGPVRGTMKGNVLRLKYAMKGGLKAEQVLTAQAGGRIVFNRMVVRKFGLPVAHLDEVITKTE